MRELVLDTETTGLDPNDNHRIVELACVELVNYIPTGQYWHWYFDPEREVPKAAVEVHGLTTQFLSSQPKFAEKAPEIAELLTGARLIIHNAAFDVGFLNHELGRLGYPAILSENVVDTLAVARRKHPGSPNSLDALCKRYGIDNTARTKHGALLDSELLAEVYLRLMGMEQAGLDLSVRQVVSETVASAAVLTRLHPLAPRITSAELDAHKAFIEGLGANALWRHYQLDEQDGSRASETSAAA